MVSVNGFHHVALICSDMKRTVDFYETVLGMKLVCLIEMHGVPGAKHCFLKGAGGTELSFVEFASPKAGIPGVSYPVAVTEECPVTTQHHMAFEVDSIADLEALRAQARAAGVLVSRPVDHGFCMSIYFDDPDGFHCEVTTTTRPYEAQDLDRSLLDRKLSPAQA